MKQLITMLIVSLLLAAVCNSCSHEKERVQDDFGTDYGPGVAENFFEELGDSAPDQE